MKRNRVNAIQRIAVVGTRGVPGRYGGFETLAEQLARSFDPQIIQLGIYGQRSAYAPAERKGPFAGHKRIWMPLDAGGMQSLLHDALQLFHASAARNDAILLLGTSGAWALPIIRLWNRKTRIITNIDGLEWRRGKFGKTAKILLKYLEKCAVRFSDGIIADNQALVPLVIETHGITPLLIAYGGDHIEVPDTETRDFHFALSRIEPENNCAMILEAGRLSGAPLTYVGNWQSTAYGKKLLDDFGGIGNLRLHPAVYDPDVLGKIRASAITYIHGHSVGGTNPSLVEALFHADHILAFDCSFNRATLEGEGAYFSSAAQLSELLRQDDSGRIAPTALARLRNRYRWQTIAGEYATALGVSV